MSRAAVALLIVSLCACPAVRGQSPLPRVGDADWGPVREQAKRLLAALRKLDGALPAAVDRKLAALLDGDVKDPDEALERLQDLLDPLCLVGVAINPESRVKAARGPAPAELSLDRPKVVLVRVHNDAGITHRLAIDGDELRAAGRAGEGRWLEAALLLEGPLNKGLSGCKLEYVPLRLTAREAGKREATLKFDAGQGTQDLGFRAEVPVLFRVGPAGRRP
jgi:hypothetical protein